jgi:hypothetical protein
MAIATVTALKWADEKLAIHFRRTPKSSESFEAYISEISYEKKAGTRTRAPG